jgi:hypothetical protein
MMHGAMFDAANSIDGTYTPYLTDVPGHSNASLEAAAAQAAHDILASLYPTRLAVFDAELAASLEGIEKNRAQQGTRVGRTAAERMLAARADEGWNAAPPAYSLPPTLGNWQPTPPANAAAAFTHYCKPPSPASSSTGSGAPVTAIRRADEDGNPQTTPDAGWSSLIASPPYPTYAGNNAAIGTSQSSLLALFFGRDDIRFEHTWEGPGGATRSYAGFGAMADEEARARVYAGIHFSFDNVAGQSVGQNVANYVFMNFMRPRRRVR